MAVATVSIAGRVLDPSGVAFASGRITAKLSNPGTAADGLESIRVATESVVDTGTGGTVALGLVPNDAITPSGTYYVVTYIMTTASGRRVQWAEKWQLPSTPTTVDIGAIPRIDVVQGLSVSTASVVGVDAAASLNQSIADLAATGTPAQSNANALAVTSTGSTTPRLMATRFADTANILDFGADPTGATDSTSAINAAIQAALGGTVVFPRGTYLAKAVAVNVAGTRLVGDAGAVLKLPALAALDGSPILLVTASEITITGLAFDGNKAAQPADGFNDSFNNGANGTGRSYRAAIVGYLSGSDLSWLTVDRCDFYDTYGGGVVTRRLSGLTVNECTATDLNFEMAWAQPDVGGPYVTDFRFTNNYLKNIRSGQGSGSPTANAVLTNRAQRVTMVGNIFDTVERNAYKCEEGISILIANNIAENITEDGFSAFQLQSGVSSATVSGNIIRNSGIGINCAPGSAGTDFSQVVISGNTVDGTTGSTNGDGISIAGCSQDHITITGNTLKGIKRKGIYITPVGTVTELVISSNNISFDGVSSSQSGISLYSSSGANWTGAHISGNRVDLAGAAGSNWCMTLEKTAAETMTGVVVIGNTFTADYGKVAILDSATVSSGVFSGNVTGGNVTLGSGWHADDTNTSLTTAGDALFAAAGRYRTALTSPVTIANNDRVVLTNLTVPGAVAVNLPSYPPRGKLFTVKDAKGDANTNNVTINRAGAQLIDGATTKVINTAYGAVRLIYDGSNWFTV